MRLTVRPTPPNPEAEEGSDPAVSTAGRLAAVDWMMNQTREP